MIAVIGHTKCGAVAGAVDRVQLGHLTGLLERIAPAVKSASSQTPIEECTSKNTALVDRCVEENVRLQVKALTQQSRILKQLVEAGEIRIAGGVYDLETGRVRFLTQDGH